VPRLSAIIITKNEAANIGACLDSVAFCYERIVIDGGSADDTVAIARQKGAQVVIQQWLGFGSQKNYALSLAKGEWVLSIDADERVTPALAEAIEAAIVEGAADCYEMPRRSSFLGRKMRHSGWNPDYVLRLVAYGPVFDRRCGDADWFGSPRLICERYRARLVVVLSDLRAATRISGWT
jgi:glycosyltransferase involved in cell wall biosynthesis